ncbi:MAG: toll/interleukin-1 receptor domain-containing protein, partial [Parasporobacterium sp.]|nr:toll/interleukin-1 receptor domain-containing protein [Parasporobacterium sp.]
MLEGERKYKYKAFISYRHTEFDKAAAKKLQKKLETYKVPKELGGGKELWKLFRDETELAAGSSLGDNIVNALKESEYMICICSGEYLRSRWCMEEISEFKKLHGGSISDIITVLIEGTPADSFPASLLTTTETFTGEDGVPQKRERAVEPLAVNIVSDTKRQALKKLDTEFLRVAAFLRQCGYDDLYQRHRKRETRKRRIIFSGVTAFLGMISAVSILIALDMSSKNEMIRRQNAELEKANLFLLEENSVSLSKESEIQYQAGDYISSIKIALSALPSPGTQRPVVPEALDILSREIGAFCEKKFVPVRQLVHEGVISEMFFTNDGKRLFTEDDGAVYCWNTQTGQMLHQYTAENLGSDGAQIRLLYDTGQMVKYESVSENTNIYRMDPGLGNISLGREKLMQADHPD